MRIKKEDAAFEMANSLIDEARSQGVDISGLPGSGWEEYLDDAFADGGEVRCEKFTDLAWPYALQYGEFDSTEFDNKRWSCTLKAVRLARKMLRESKCKECGK